MRENTNPALPTGGPAGGGGGPHLRVLRRPGAGDPAEGEGRAEVGAGAHQLGGRAARMPIFAR